MSDFKLSAEHIDRAKHGRDFIFGVDLGQAKDYTAIVVLERIEELTGAAAKGKWVKQVRYALPYLEKPPLGTPYPAIIGRLKELIAGLPDYERLKIEVSALDCPRISDDFLEQERQALGDLWFRQEYGCEFLETIDQVFRYDDIERALSDEVEPLFGTGREAVAGDVRALLGGG